MIKWFMLKYLSIANLVIISKLEVEFHKGLNLLTGETGTGKSIVVDALGLLTGSRGGSELVRSGARNASIEGVFQVTGRDWKRIGDVLGDLEVVVDCEAELILRREVQANGRSRIFINDQSVTSLAVKLIQPVLLNILGQAGQQSVADRRYYLKLLDSFAGCAPLRRKIAIAFAQWKAAKEGLKNLENDNAQRESATDYLRFQIAEIENAAPREGESEELEVEKRILAHAERTIELTTEAYNLLYEGDRSALELIGLVRRRLQDLSTIDARAGTLLERLDEAALALTDVAGDLRGYVSTVSFSPDRLREVENRLAELERLKRKYGRDAGALVDVKNELARQLQDLNNLEHRKCNLSAELEAAKRDYIPLAQSLSAARRRTAPHLQKRVMEELKHLAMEHANFVVSLKSASSLDSVNSSEGVSEHQFTGGDEADDESFWTSDGVDIVDFLLSANVGEPAQSLSRVASGGEVSRLMLTLHNVCQNSEAASRQTVTATLVFDEIDVGVGGKVAEAVGRRLKSLAGDQQVLCVTHQAQIARFADHHYSVTKSVDNGRTVTTMRELNAEERVGELARMIGGAEDVEAARVAASWMLEESGLFKRKEPHQKLGKRTTTVS